MADESRSSTTTTQTSQEPIKPPLKKTLRLSAQLPLDQASAHPTVSSYEHSSEPSIKRELSLERSPPNHGFCSDKDVQAAMLESPARGRKDSSSSIKSHHSIRTRSRSSRDKDGATQKDSTPRQDSAYFSNKDTQEEEVQEDPDGQNQRGSSRQESIEIVIRGRTFTSSPPPITRGGDEGPFQYDGFQSEEDTGSEIDANIQARQMRAHERVAILRGQVSRTRRMVKNRRVELRELRGDVRDAVARLTRKITEIVTLKQLDEDITPYQQTLRIAEDRLGPAEEEYEKLEIRLEDEEWELEEEENYFYRHHEVSIAVPESRLDSVISPRAHVYQPSEDDIPNLDFENGLMQEFLKKIADATRVKEELDELEGDFFRFSDESDFRKRFSIPISAEVSNFFREYSELHSNLIQRVDEIEDEIFDLRDRCIKDGLFGKDEYKYDHYSALYEELMEPVYYTQDRLPFRVAARRMHSREHDLDYGDKQNAVNSWLLEWVQESAVHILMLKTEIFCELAENSELDSNFFDDEKWAELALENWHQDTAGESANENYNASRFDQISGSPRRFHGTSTACSGRSGRSGIPDSLRSLDASSNTDEEVEMVEEKVVKTSASPSLHKMGKSVPTLIKRRVSI